MKELSEIAINLRKKHTECKIVQMIKNREIADIENGYKVQQNYPAGVYVWTATEDDGGVMFGSKL